MKIQDKAMLASLNISQWTARKYDRGASQATADLYKAAGSEVRTTKAMVAKTHLDEITKIVGKARTYHYDHTLPYSKGQAILATDLLSDYMAEIGKNKRAFADAVNKFIDVYPSLVQEAQINLGGLYNGFDYPNERQLRRKFQMDVDFAPIPEGSHLRINIDQAELAEMQAEIEAKANDAITQAMNGLWQRVYDVTAALQERLTPDGSGKDKTFRDSLIGNIADLADILPRMNLSDDPDLDAMAREIKAELASYDPKDLRNSKAMRKDALAKAGEILSKVSGYMGADPIAPIAPEPVEIIVQDVIDQVETAPEPSQEPSQAEIPAPVDTEEQNKINERLTELGLI